MHLTSSDIHERKTELITSWEVHKRGSSEVRKCRISVLPCFIALSLHRFPASALLLEYTSEDISYKKVDNNKYAYFPFFHINIQPWESVFIFYSIGYVFNLYNDTTIYNKIEENLGRQSLSIALRIQQKWGSANVSVSASSYLHDFNKNQVQLDGNLRLRLFKGLSLSIDGGVAFIHDQIELVKGDISNEDLYLRLRQLETGFRYDGSLGITYTFGSIYNNVVNPRF